MSSKYPILKPKDVIAVLQKSGFAFVSQKGSHAKYTDGTHVVIVPMHDEIARGTLRSILDMAGISLDNFMKKL